MGGTLTTLKHSEQKNCLELSTFITFRTFYTLNHSSNTITALINMSNMIHKLLGFSETLAERLVS